MFDPFADGRKGARAGQAYGSPGQVMMGGINTDPTPLASYIPSGAFGGRSVGKGTLLPRHKPGRGGGSTGYNPHKPPHKHVIVDPHVPGRAVSLDLAKVSTAASDEAYQAGMDWAGEIMADPPEELDGIEMTIEEGPRLGAYAAVRLLAENGATPDTASRGLRAPGQPQGPPMPPQPQPYVVPPASTGRAKAAAFGVATAQRANPQVQVFDTSGRSSQAPAAAVAGPMARFRPQPAPPQPAAQPAQVVDQGRAQDRDQAGGPPTRKVVFDFGDRVGQFPAQYHDVVRSPGGLILVWDERWPYGEPYSPESLTEQFAVAIDGDPQVYLVMAIGNSLSFRHGHFRYFPLGVIESMPANGQAREVSQ